MLLNAADAAPVLTRWTETSGGTARLVSYSENHVFEIVSCKGQLFSLRVHRPGYQTRAAVQSELAWLKALGRDTNLNLPRPVAGVDGELLQTMNTSPGEPRLAVLFNHAAGVEPNFMGDLSPLFAKLGHYAAVLHNHAMQWKQPPGFQRPVWRVAEALDLNGIWGDWRDAPGVGSHNVEVLERLERTIRQYLGDYGTGPDRFGLIHADMRLGNLLLDGDRMTLIDFDDCGFCWFVYDFAAAISFHESHPAIPALKAAWLESYCRVRKLDAADLAAMDTMIMLRRLALLAWIGSHGETRLAQQHREGFADGTAELADRYLRGPIWPL